MTEDYIIYLTLNGHLIFNTMMTEEANLDNEL